jgi:phosphoglycolate phosphatase
VTSPEWVGVDVVLFDWNGTLVDDVERACASLNTVLAHRALPTIGLDEFKQGFRLPLSRWLATLGVESADLATAEAEWNREVRSRPTEIQRGARDLLSRLTRQGRVVGVVSAASTDAVVADLDRTGLGQFVEFVAGDSADKVVALGDAVEDGQMGVYIGDVEYDIESGHAAGLLTVAFAGGYRPRAELERARPDAVVDSLVEIATLLRLD